MLYTAFQDKKLSLLGFGAMRLPVKDGMIDEEMTFQMVDEAMKAGVNYFDTAYPYHSGHSERVIGRALERYPRDSYYLATKFPGHQVRADYDPEKVFEEQLKKCRTEYFDFYLLHNVCETSIDTYTDPKWGIVDYFIKQKKLGRIRHLGFSSHGKMENLKKWLELYAEHMEFCQIQLNYMDWTLQNGKEKVDLLNERDMPIWVMEPVRGGKLSNMAKENEEKLKALRPHETVSAWAFRFLQDVKGVKVILSGMSNMEQLADNIHTFTDAKPLTDSEKEVLFDIAEGMKNAVPCTSCRYCTDHCPMELNIPELISTFNEMRFSTVINAPMFIETLDENKKPKACIACGACKAVCPQRIDIPNVLKEFAEKLAQIPSWAETCRKRDEEQRKMDALQGEKA